MNNLKSTILIWDQFKILTYYIQRQTHFLYNFVLYVRISQQNIHLTFKSLPTQQKKTSSMIYSIFLSNMYNSPTLIPLFHRFFLSHTACDGMFRHIYIFFCILS